MPSDSYPIYLIDGNNYVCWEAKVGRPTCDQLQSLVDRLQVWLWRQYRCDWDDDEGDAYWDGPSAWAVFDAGAHQCTFPSNPALRVVVARPGSTADSVIWWQARQLLDSESARLVIITDDRRDEFAELAEEVGEGLQLKHNTYLRNKLPSEVSPHELRPPWEDPDDLWGPPRWWYRPRSGVP